MNFKIQDLADKEGNINYNLKKIKLAPSGRQIDVGFNYINQISENFVFGIKNTFTKDLDHFKKDKLNHSLTVVSSISF